MLNMRQIHFGEKKLQDGIIVLMNQWEQKIITIIQLGLRKITIFILLKIVQVY